METKAAIMASLPWLETMALNVLFAIITLVVGWWFSNFIGNWIRKIAQRSTHIDFTIVPMAQALVTWTIRVFVIVAVLARFGVQTASLIAALGAAGLAIGLALHNTLQNIASGIMLLILRPIRSGEFVSIVGKGDGTVLEVGLFMSEFQQTDGVKFVLPNSLIWGNPIINYSRNETRRMEIAVGVRYGDDLDKALEVLSDLFTSHEKVLKDPAPLVFVSAYKESTVVVSVRAWTKTVDFWDVHFEMNRVAIQKLQEAGLSNPIPLREVVALEKPAA